jgi:hypothetical protein
MRKKLTLGAFLAMTLASLLIFPLRATAGSGAGQQQKKAAKPAAKSGAGHAEAEKALVANERAVMDAVAKGNAAAFKEHVAADSWAVDPMSGRMSTADFLAGFDKMTKEMKLTSWDLSDVKTYWADPNVAVVTYQWTGQGTYQGRPIPSPLWASTVWAKRGGKWMAVYHQETAVSPSK